MSPDFQSPNQPNENDELLSAYIDGEASKAESQKVERLLQENQEIQKKYKKLLKLKKSIKKMPHPPMSVTAEELCREVLKKNRQYKQKRQKYWWGGGAIASVFFLILSSVFNQTPNPINQFAETQPSASEPLIVSINEITQAQLKTKTLKSKSQLVITLNQPVVAMPK